VNGVLGVALHALVFSVQGSAAVLRALALAVDEESVSALCAFHVVEPIARELVDAVVPSKVR
jgi:hypothetical protein